MSDTRVLPSKLGRHVDHLCDCFEAAWKTWQSGERPRIGEVLATTSEPERSVLLRELVQLEVHYRSSRGDRWTIEEFQGPFPELDPDWLADVAANSTTVAANSTVADFAERTSFDADSDGQANSADSPFEGYEILETIRSGMAVVYQALQQRPAPPGRPEDDGFGGSLTGRRLAIFAPRGRARRAAGSSPYCSGIPGRHFQGPTVFHHEVDQRRQLVSSHGQRPVDKFGKGFDSAGRAVAGQDRTRGPLRPPAPASSTST